jgi:nitroimidazol reductase NimA-like FMN-containing flavoprotein (pyridoxamine 5'-phosphate oxidase superfamily)
MATTERAGEEWRGKVGPMSRAEMEEFLSGDVLCRLSCLDDEGWPYTVPVWFGYRDDGFYIIPRERSVWARYVQRDPRVYLCIDEPGRQRKVLVRGEARVVEEPNVGGGWVEIANEMSYRYLGEHGPDYLVPTLNEPRWLIFVTPRKVTTWQGVDWAARYKHSRW